MLTPAESQTHTHTIYMANKHNRTQTHTHTPHHLSWQPWHELYQHHQEIRVTHSAITASDSIFPHGTESPRLSMSRMAGAKLGRTFGQLMYAIVERFESDIVALDPCIALVP